MTTAVDSGERCRPVRWWRCGWCRTMRCRALCSQVVAQAPLLVGVSGTDISVEELNAELTATSFTVLSCTMEVAPALHSVIDSEIYVAARLSTYLHVRRFGPARQQTRDKHVHVQHSVRCRRLLNVDVISGERRL